MDTAPTKNPDSAPKHTPATITTAMTGLNCGSIKNAARPATAMAAKSANMTSSRAWGRRFSNIIKKGTMAIMIIARETA